MNQLLNSMIKFMKITLVDFMIMNFLMKIKY